MKKFLMKKIIKVGAKKQCTTHATDKPIATLSDAYCVLNNYCLQPPLSNILRYVS